LILFTKGAEMGWRSVCIPVTIGVRGVAAGHTAARWLRHWGSTVYEQEHRWPGDELCPSARTVHTRAVTIDAPPEQVWPWLMQIGQDRSGFFSYTFLENLVGCDMPNVPEVRPDWQERLPGDKVLMTTPRRYGGKAYNVVAHVDPGTSLVLVAPGDLGRLNRGEEANWVWQFVLVPEGIGTRLVVRSRYRTRQRLLEPVHFVMERKMMLTIKRLSEAGPTRSSAMVTVPRRAA
jgi:hypothetical protein